MGDAPDLIDRRREEAISDMNRPGIPSGSFLPEATIGARFTEHVASRLGVADLDIEWRRTETPGEDADNVAHTHGSDDLRSFVVEHSMTDPLDQDARRTVIHELLHVAFRHVAAVAKHVESGPAKAWLTQAIEEDTEALAEALERWIGG